MRNMKKIKMVWFRFFSIGIICLICQTAELVFGQSAESFIPNPQWTKIAGDLNFPEGPAWNGKDALFVSNCYGGWIAQITDSKVDTFVTARSIGIQKTNGTVFDSFGNLFACDYGLKAIVKISPAKSMTIIADSSQSQPFNRPNDLAFSKSGNLYFTDPNRYDRQNPDGKVYCISGKDRSVRIVHNAIAFPNGIAFSEDGKQMFVCESAANRILIFDILQSGNITNGRTFVELPGGDPDGIALDVQGNLYVAHFGGGAIYIITPDGKILQKISAPGKKPSNLEFGGKDMKTLFLTEVETNSVYKMEVPVSGLKLFRSSQFK